MTEIERLNGLKGRYFFASAGLGDVVVAKVGTAIVATLRFAPRGAIVLGGTEEQGVKKFLEDNHVVMWK